MSRLLAFTAAAALASVFMATEVHAGGKVITKALKTLTDDAVQGGVGAGKRVDGAVRKSPEGAASAGTRENPITIYDYPSPPPRAAPPRLPDHYDDVDTLVRGAGDNAAAAPAPDALPPGYTLAPRPAAGAAPPRAAGYGTVDGIAPDVLPPRAAGYGTVDGIAPDVLPPRAAGYGTVDGIAPDVPRSGYDLLPPPSRNAEGYDIVPPPARGASGYDVVPPARGAEPHYANPGAVEAPVYRDLDDLDDLVVVRAKPPKPPMTKLRGKNNAVSAAGAAAAAGARLPVAPALRAAVPAVPVAMAKQGISRKTNLMIGGGIGAVIVGGLTTTMVLYATVEPVTDNIDTSKAAFDGALQQFGEFLRPGDPATVTFFNQAATLVELYKVNSDGSETSLATLSTEGLGEVVNLRIGDRVSVHKGGVPANQFYDITDAYNGGEIYVE